MRQHHFKILGIVVLMLLSLSTVTSQDADTAALDAIQHALDSLADGYAYTIETTITQQYAAEEADSFGTYVLEVADGRVDSNKNYHVMRSFRGGETEASLDESPTFTMQLLALDSILYVQFENISEIYPTIFSDIDNNWHIMDDLIAPYEDNTAEQLIIKNLTHITLLTDFPLTDNLIQSIEEHEPTTMAGQDVRVLEVEVDARQVFIAQNSGTLEQIQMLLEAADFMTKSEFTLTFTLWIGADDGLLYGGESVGYTNLPYFTEEQDGPPYDITIDSMSVFMITAHGTGEAITLPEELE